MGAIFVAYRWRIAAIRARNRVALAERTRISREIHDTLLQSVVGAELVLRSVAQSVADKDARRKFDRVLEGMQIAMTETRHALFDMRTPNENAASLTERISQHGQYLAEIGQMRFHFELRGTAPPLDSEAESEIFKIVREAILNAVKHSRAKDLTVIFGFAADGLRITVQDDGVGFDNTSFDAVRHWGVLGMGERAKSLGGSCIVTSSAGEGTTVTIELPCRVLARRRSQKQVLQET